MLGTKVAAADTRKAPAEPGQVALAFAEAHNAGDLALAASFFARDACFVTPDATAVRGRKGIGEVLAQMISGRVQIRIEAQGMISVGDSALSVQGWTMCFQGIDAPFVQASNSVLLLRREELTWKLLIVAPWGLGAASGAAE
jgi:ketosteroid isomerase-like protein